MSDQIPSGHVPTWSDSELQEHRVCNGCGAYQDAVCPGPPGNICCLVAAEAKKRGLELEKAPHDVIMDIIFN